MTHLVRLCWEYRTLSDFDKGLAYGAEALTLAKKLNYKKGEVNALNNIGVIYYSSTSYPKALDNFFVVS